MRDPLPGPGWGNLTGILAARAAALGFVLLVLGSASELERWGILPLVLACLVASIAVTTALLLARR